jgi:hypothetical protein
MRVLSLFILLVGTAICFEYEHVDDSCNAIAYYMKRKGLQYSQKFSKEPGKCTVQSESSCMYSFENETFSNFLHN